MPGPIEGEKRERPLKDPWLWGILAVALLLRVWGIGFGLPYAFHPDEGQYVQQALHMGKTLSLRPWTMCNPSLYTYSLMAALGPPIGLLSFMGWPKEDLIPLAYLIARLVNVTSGVGAVYLLYLIGSCYVGPIAGRAAALFLALNFLHGRDSHFATNDVPAVTIGLIAFYLILRWLEGFDRVAAPAGLALGLAVAMKYNLAVLALPLGWVIIVRWLQGRDSRAAITTAVASGAAAVAGFLLGTPYALLDATRFLADLRAKAALGTVPEFGQTLDPAGVFYLQASAQGAGALVLALAMIGALLVWRKERRSLGFLIFLVVLPYFVLMFKYKIALVRYLLPVLPFLCLLAAIVLQELHQIVRSNPAMRYGVASLLIVSVLEPAGRLIWHDVLLVRDDTRIQANKWIEKHLPPGTRIGIEDYGPPLGHEYLMEYEWALPVRTPESWRNEGTQYVITSSFMADRTGPNPERPLGKRGSQGCGSYPPEGFSPKLYGPLLAGARAVATFSPWQRNESLPFALDDVYSPFWRVWDWRFAGPRLTVYQLS